MDVMVTGATGLLGSNVVRALEERGARVRAVVRDLDRAARLLPGVSLVEGDLDDVGTWAHALDGADALVHGAAYFREYYTERHDEEALERRNVTAVRQLLSEAAQRGVRFALHVSSGGVLGRADGAPATEADAPGPLVAGNGYFASKWRAEAVVAEVAARVAMPIAMVRPGWMHGPGDAAPTSAGRLVLDIAAGALPAVPSGSVDVVDARDVAAAIATIVERGEAGVRNLAGAHRSTGEVFDAIADALGVARVRHLPRAVTPLMLGLARATLRVTGTGWPAHPAGIATLTGGVRASSARAEVDLGFRSRPFAETAADAVAWFRSAGELAAPAVQEPAAAADPLR
jgi:dihydroflavonol-4-reductase